MRNEPWLNWLVGPYVGPYSKQTIQKVYMISFEMLYVLFNRAPY